MIKNAKVVVFVSIQGERVLSLDSIAADKAAEFREAQFAKDILALEVPAADVERMGFLNKDGLNGLRREAEARVRAWLVRNGVDKKDI
jgi:hypothetical protein